MKILVLNPGSSSIKFSLFAGGGTESMRSAAEGELTGIGGASQLSFRDATGKDLGARAGEVKARTMHEAASTVETVLADAGSGGVDALGYRVVHPGPRLRGHQRITEQVLRELQEAVRFAPLHDPVALELMEEMKRRMPDVPHVACFDTVFHETIPEVARTYALPREVRAEGVRRFGFHGLSCESVMQEMVEAGVAAENVVIAHLGSGCSVTSVVNGRSAFNTMGLTPTGGVVMGTRPGDLDPGVLMFLLRREKATIDSVEGMVNRESGLKALGGVNDMRELRRRALNGDEDARLAMEVFVTSVGRAVAAEMVLGRASGVVFTGGIGEHDAKTREEVCRLLRGLGVELDDAANAAGLGGAVLRRVSAEASRIAVYIAKADEDRVIAQHVVKICFGSQ